MFEPEEDSLYGFGSFEQVFIVENKENRSFPKPEETAEEREKLLSSLRKYEKSQEDSQPSPSSYIAALKNEHISLGSGRLHLSPSFLLWESSTSSPPCLQYSFPLEDLVEIKPKSLPFEPPLLLVTLKGEVFIQFSFPSAQETEVYEIASILKKKPVGTKGTSLTNIREPLAEQILTTASSTATLTTATLTTPVLTPSVEVKNPTSPGKIRGGAELNLTRVVTRTSIAPSYPSQPAISTQTPLASTPTTTSVTPTTASTITSVTSMATSTTFVTSMATSTTMATKAPKMSSSTTTSSNEFSSSAEEIHGLDLSMLRQQRKGPLTRKFFRLQGQDIMTSKPLVPEENESKEVAAIRLEYATQLQAAEQALNREISEAQTRFAQKKQKLDSSLAAQLASLEQRKPAIAFEPPSECQLCYSDVESMEIKPCGHKLCSECGTKLQEFSKCCPWDRAPFDSLQPLS